jgi:hypothetical protein
LARRWPFLIFGFLLCLSRQRRDRLIRRLNVFVRHGYVHLGRRNAVAKINAPTRISTAAQTKRNVEAVRIDSPCDRYALAASVSANPKARTTSPDKTRIIVEIKLRPLDQIAIAVHVAAERRLKTMFIQNAHTAFSGVPPERYSDVTAGITISAINNATKTISTEQINNERVLNNLFIIMPPI